MKFIETIISAYTALLANKVRSMLTMLGVVIGVFAVVSLVSLVRGVQNYVTDQFNSLGSNLLYVYPGSGGLSNDPALSFSANKLSKRHVDLIERHAHTEVGAISPVITITRLLKYKTKSFYAGVVGSNYQTAHILNIDLDKGAFFTKEDELSNAKVAVIGPVVERELFPNKNPIGEKVKVGEETFTVVGVSAKKNEEFDQQIIVPFTAIEQVFHVRVYSFIALKAKEGVDVEYASKAVEIALLNDLTTDDFTMFSQKEILNSVQQILGILSVALGAVAGISLLVGGIGIMNIMLVSVTERIREIGLRKALGATSFNIGLQFMMESIALSVFGGATGLGFGWIATLIAQKWIRAEITSWSVLLAMGFSILIGVGFGTYPALNAAKKDPIEALRYE